MDDSFAIDKLAKVIVDTIPKPKDVGDTLYGTIVSYSDNLYVRVDGSDQLTPVKSTASYSDGERVAVLIKDHKAVVTGNFSHPSATEASVESSVATIDNKITELGNVVATKVSTSDFEATNATVKNLVTDDTTIKNTLKAHDGKFDSIKTETAEIEGRITAAEGDIDQLQATQIKAETLDAKYATIENLNATNTDVHTLQTDYADVTTKLTAAEADISDLETKKLNVDKAEATYATIDQLQAGYAHISNGVIDNATIDQAKVNNLSSHYAAADLANVTNAWINKGVVRDGAISNAMIGELNAGKITSGTLDAGLVDVSHLNASSITTGKLTVGGVTLDVANGTSSVSGSALTKGSVTMDRLDTSVKDAIDGAIETWTVSAVPTLSNAPASKWTDSATRDKHVGDIAYVVNSGKTADGYAYRFAKSSDGTYSWVLIKDSDVTAALSRLTTAEGNISGLQTFEHNSEAWQTKTDSSITTLSSSTTSLATRMSTAEGTLKNKVDTTTFSALSDTVDGHTQKITKATSDIQTLTSKQGTLESTVSTQTTKINDLEETADGSKQRISALETTTTDQGTRIATAESNISKNAKAIETKVSSSTYSTDKAGLEAKIESNSTAITQKSSELSAKISSTETSVKSYADGKVAQEVTDRNSAITAASNGIKAQMSETYTTKTEFNALEIGGRNLVYSSVGPHAGGRKPIGTDMRDLVFDIGRGGRIAYTADILAPYVPETVGDDGGGRAIVVSLDARIGESGTERGLPGINIYPYQVSGISIHEINYLPLTKKWNRFSIVVHAWHWAQGHHSDGTPYTKGEIWLYDQYGSNDIQIRNVKIELGNRPTDWTPAPEDLASGKSLSDLNTTLTTQYTKTADFTVAPSQLAAKFTSTESSVKSYADGKVSAEATARNAAISASADGVKSYVAQTYTTKDTTNAISSKLDQTASGLTSEVQARQATDKNLADNYMTSAQVESKIKQSADSIESTVTSVSNSVDNIVNGYVRTIDLTADTYNTDWFYPCVFSFYDWEFHKKYSFVVADGGVAAPWSTHNSKLIRAELCFDFTPSSYGWVANNDVITITRRYASFVSPNSAKRPYPFYVTQATNVSSLILFLRGGAKYKVASMDTDGDWTIYPTEYVAGGSAYYKYSAGPSPAEIGTDQSAFRGRISTAEAKIATAETKITQNAIGITLAASKTESLYRDGRFGENMLLDTDAPSLVKVNAEHDRHLTDHGTPASDALSATIIPSGTDSVVAPDGIKYMLKLTASGSATVIPSKSIEWYADNCAVKMVNGEKYTQWVYAYSSTAVQKVRFGYGVTKWPYRALPIEAGKWQLVHWSFTYTDADTGGTGGAKVQIGAVFPKATAASIYLCGFRLTRGEADEDVYATKAALKLASDSITTEVSARQNADKSISDRQSTLEQTVSGINTRVSTVEKSYVKSDEYSADRKQTDKTITDRVQQATTDADGKTVLEQINSINQTIDGTTQTFERHQSELDDLKGTLDDITASISTYMDESNRPVLEMGASSSNLKTRLTNDALEFIASGRLVAEASGDRFRAPMVDADDIRIGGYAFTESTDGSVSIDWKGV